MSIQPGDMVVIIRRSPCGCAIGYPGPYRVARIVTDVSWCACGATWGPRQMAVWDEPALSGAELWQLLKIDPPALPETITRDEEMPA